MKLGKLKLDIPQAIVISVSVAALALVLTFAPEDTREMVVKGLGWVGMLLSSLLRPLLTRAPAEPAQE